MHMRVAYLILDALKVQCHLGLGQPYHIQHLCQWEGTLMRCMPMRLCSGVIDFPRVGTGRLGGRLLASSGRLVADWWLLWPRVANHWVGWGAACHLAPAEQPCSAEAALLHLPSCGVH